MCELAEYFESSELAIFDSSDHAPNYADDMESDGTDDSKSDFPEAECAMALLELAQSFGLVSSLNSFDHDPGPRYTEPSNVHRNNSVTDLANAHQHVTVFDRMQLSGEYPPTSKPSCSAEASALHLLSVVRLDHSYEMRRPRAPVSIPSGNRALKKAKSATTLEKLRKMRKKNKMRKTDIGQRYEERQNAALGSGLSSPRSDLNAFPATVSQVKSQSHQRQNMNVLRKVPLEEPFKIPSNAKALFGIRGKRELLSS